MRPSNRSRILDAAVRVIQRDGVTAITYESVAAEAALTRGGLLYHFPSREALLLGLHEHLAAQWEADMVDAAGAPAQRLTAAQRHAAYARASTRGATRAELLMMVEGAAEPAHVAAWQAVMDRWSPPPPKDFDDTAALTRFVARLAADGLWLHDAAPESRLSPALRRRIAEHLATLLAPDDQDTPAASAPARRR